MVKSRMGLLDLRAQTMRLNDALCGSRVTNVYDAQDGRTYILKLSVPPQRLDGKMEGKAKTNADMHGHTSWEKKLLLLESGIRLHMTQYDREKDIPSGFCLKLRKHIRSRRLTYIRQLGGGGDRIVDIAFSCEGVISSHLLVEVFSGGNVILTDADFSILTLLRTYKLSRPSSSVRSIQPKPSGQAVQHSAPSTSSLVDNSEPSSNSSEIVRVAVRERYPVENARQRTPLQFDSFQSAILKAKDSVPSSEQIANMRGRAARRKLSVRGLARKALAVELSVEPAVIEHALLMTDLPGDATVDALHAAGIYVWEAVFREVVKVDETLEQVSDDVVQEGYIVSSCHTSSHGSEKYEEFTPFLFAQYREKPYKKFATFDEAVDEFFAHVETDRVEAAQSKREAAVYKKVHKLESELEGQVSAFEKARDRSWVLAQALEANVVEADAAICVIRSAISAAVSWDDLGRMVEDERNRGNPVAEIIHSLQLEKNEITLLLEDSFGHLESSDDGNDGLDVSGSTSGADEDGSLSEDSESVGAQERSSSAALRNTPQGRDALLVHVDVNLSAHANARRYYEIRKSAGVKMEKAAEAKDRTVKAASKKAANEARVLEERAVAASIRARRIPFWFEKFQWFISSENYLVVAGRDQQQNELLVKRYLAPADVYVHADLEGASSVIVKNQKCSGEIKYKEIPQVTLEQAGTFALCRSTAWESKIVTSAWWVRASQVSKTDSFGEYLPVGSFAIRGKKQFLEPAQLVMGLGYLFKVDEASAVAQSEERTPKESQEGTPSEGKSPCDPVHEASRRSPTDPTRPGNIKPVDLVPIPEHSLTSSSLQKEAHGRSEQLESEELMSSEKIDDKLEAAVHAVSLLDAHNGQPHQDEALTSSTNNPTSHVDSALDLSGGRSQRQCVDDRKKQKAQLNESCADQTESTKKSSGGQSERKIPSGMSDKQPLSKSSNVVPRGKKHKLKKMKKYKDQDEEERKIALSLLGSKPIKEHLSDGQVVLERRSDSPTGAEVEMKVSAKKAPRDGASGQKREGLMFMHEDGLAELERLEKDTVEALRLLTFLPTAQDSVEFALPVCAPFGAIALYKYRAKLVPGTMKRGKAYRAAMVLFQREAEKNLETCRSERDAIRLSSESDGIHAMVGNVKIMARGLAEAQKSIQKGSKVSKRSSKKGI